MTIRTTRRQALKLGAAAGALSVAGFPALAQSEPSRGGTFRVAKGHGSTTDVLDPGKIENGTMIANAFTYGNMLVEIDADSAVIPELAESWETNDGADVWTFKLRQGVKFHDGSDVTADDVVASINHHRGEDNTSAAAPIVEPITEIKAVDDTTIEFTLEAGNADFPYTVADYHLVILPAKEDGTIDWQSGIATGPYKIDEFEPGVRIRYSRNEDYWKEGRAWFDKIENLSIVDPTARVNALVTGEVDAIDKVPLQVAGRIANSGNVELQEVVGNQHYTFAMHVDVEPYQENAVRQALKYAVNRQEMVDKILLGYGTVGNDHPIGPNQRFFNDELEQKSYDPEKARQLLADAGVENLSVDLHAADAAFPGAVDAAQLFAESAAQAGITVNVVREPNDGYWSNVWLKEPFSAVYWGGRPTANGAFTIAYAEGVAWNDTHFANERFNELLVEARAELDEEKRREMYYEMQDILANQGGTIIPMFASYVFAHNPQVSHDAMASNWDMDGERWAERWWFSE